MTGLESALLASTRSRKLDRKAFIPSRPKPCRRRSIPLLWADSPPMQRSLPPPGISFCCAGKLRRGWAWAHWNRIPLLQPALRLPAQGRDRACCPASRSKSRWPAQTHHRRRPASTLASSISRSSLRVPSLDTLTAPAQHSALFSALPAPPSGSSTVSVRG